MSKKAAFSLKMESPPVITPSSRTEPVSEKKSKKQSLKKAYAAYTQSQNNSRNLHLDSLICRETLSPSSPPLPSLPLPTNPEVYGYPVRLEPESPTSLGKLLQEKDCFLNQARNGGMVTLFSPSCSSTICQQTNLPTT